MAGYLYFAINPLMPGLTKIGFTEKVLADRFSDLQGTGVPVPFELFAAVHVEDPQSCEKGVHAALAQERVSNNREFFRISPKEALARVWPLVLANVSAVAPNSQPSVGLFADLDCTEQEVLSAYALAPTYQRPNDWGWIQQTFEMDELDCRHYFHSLKTKGYLREVKGTGGAILYDLAPRGVSFGRSMRNE